MADNNNKGTGIFLFLGALAAAAYYVFKVKVTNAIQGQPTFIVTALHLNPSRSTITMQAQNPGNIAYPLHSIQANIMDSGNRVATASFLPGANGAVLKPYSRTQIVLTINLDPVGSIMDIINTGLQIIDAKAAGADLSKASKHTFDIIGTINVGGWNIPLHQSMAAFSV